MTNCDAAPGAPNIARNRMFLEPWIAARRDTPSDGRAGEDLGDDTTEAVNRIKRELNKWGRKLAN
jgi:hypothetical protein